MAATMQAAYFVGENQLELREAPVPTPGPGEVLLAVSACGICGSDLHQFAGRWPQPKFVPGHEISGVVEQIGSEVEDFAPEDHVCVEPFLFCGRCYYCLMGRYLHCEQMGFLSLTADGGFAEKVVVPAYSLHRLPANVGDEVGALAEPLAVGVHGVRLARVTAGDEVLVLGAGAIGLMCLAAARLHGADHVYISARYPYQGEAAMSLEADGVFNTDPEVLRGQVEQAYEHGPEVVIEAVGTGAGTIQLALDLAGALGRVVIVGGDTGRVNQLNVEPLTRKELTVLGSRAYGQIGARPDFEVTTELLAKQPSVFERLITHRFSLEQVQEAFLLAADKHESEAIKVLVFPHLPEEPEEEETGEGEGKSG